jgi:Zn-dependent peptidase ImmA (M78 family)
MPDPPSPSDAVAAAERTLEAHWNLGAQPTIPVDPIFIAKQMGLKVWVASLEDGVAGMLVKQPPSDPEIYLSVTDGRTRQRFTCGHELGHYVMREELMRRDPADDDSWAYVDRRDQLSGRGSDPTERYANNFAACLLMPEREVKRLKDQFPISRLATEFGVSAEAMNYRLANLRSGMTTQ